MTRILFRCALALIVAGFLVSSVSAQNRYRDMIEPPIDGAFLGAWANPALGKQVDAIASLEKTLGHRLAVHLSYWQFNSGNELSAISADPAVQDDIDKGRIPLISWGCSRDAGTTFQQIADGGDLDTLYTIPGAEAVKSLESRVFIRLSWEFNLHLGDPQTIKGNSCFTPANWGNLAAEEAEFIAYFRHIVEVFREQGVHNVTWLRCPSSNEDALSKYPVAEFYPGGEYVDWIAGDAYDKPTEPARGFEAIWTPFWTAFHAYGKPMLIAETGEVNNATDGFTQKKFFEDAAAALSPGGIFNRSPWERIAALTYFDAEDSTMDYDWAVETPTTDIGGEKAWAALAGLPYFERRTLWRSPW